MPEFRRSITQGKLFAVLGAVFAGIAAVVAVSFGRYGVQTLTSGVIPLIIATPALAALGLFVLARRQLRHRPVLLSVDAGGISVAGRPPLPWSEVAAIYTMAMNLGWGVRDAIGIRPRIEPAGIAAEATRRKVGQVFEDRSIVPAHIGLSTEEVLAELDTALAGAGLARSETPKSGLRPTHYRRTWAVVPAP